jgi:uncharacterized protein (TIGR03663 family)
LDKLANTASTKSGASKKAQGGNTAAVDAKSRAVETPLTTDDIPERAWQIGVIVTFLVALVLRVYDLNLVPLHHDEGVNGNFLVRLVREGAYQYDPENYHGPTLYYFAAFFPWVMRVLFGKSAQENYGLTTVSIRLVPALFGLATIVLIFLLRRHLGTIATLTAALLLALSPGAVYLSRYFIHETQFVFFTLGIVVASLYYYEQRNGFYLILASASAALLFATKETAMISVGVLIIAFVVTLVYLGLRRRKPRSPKARGRIQPQPRVFSRLVDHFGGPMVFWVYVVIAVLVFVALWVLFYSSFFTNSKGIADSFKTFEVWTRTGTVAHVHPFLTYGYWLVMREGPLLCLGVVGAVLVVLKPKSAFALFAALWAFGIIAAYSLIPYKTPWLMLSFLVPLALIGGYALQEIYEIDKRLMVMVLLVALGVALYQTIDLNFINYDNDDSRYVYVYAHTTRGMLELVKQIDEIARQESGNSTGITIVSPDYWPLPWYLRNYTRVGYFGRLAASTEPLIIANENQKPDIDANFGELYQEVPSSQTGGSYELRPGVRLLLYERRKGFTPTEPPSIRRPSGS